VEFAPLGWRRRKELLRKKKAALKTLQVYLLRNNDATVSQAGTVQIFGGRLYTGALFQ
jgi:hypothetical protein